MQERASARMHSKAAGGGGETITWGAIRSRSCHLWLTLTGSPCNPAFVDLTKYRTRGGARDPKGGGGQWRGVRPPPRPPLLSRVSAHGRERGCQLVKRGVRGLQNRRERGEIR